MKNIRVFLSENFQFLMVKVSIYLNRLVFVMGLSKSTVLSEHAHFAYVRKDGLSVIPERFSCSPALLLNCESGKSITYKIVSAPVEVSEQPACPRSLIRAFAGQSLGSPKFKVSSCIQGRL